MARYRDLTGHRYGRLTVLEYAGKRRERTAWKCLCECGNEIVLPGCDMRSGNTSSCGCLHDESVKKLMTTHGHKRDLKVSPTYHSWSGMKTRCNNPNHYAYPRYGGRGISYDPEWEVFENFLRDMGEKPAGMTLDRIDNDGNYCKENCRWVNQQSQVNNSTVIKPITYRGKTQSVAAWSRELGIHRDCIYGRLRRGLSPREALRKAA